MKKGLHLFILMAMAAMPFAQAAETISVNHGDGSITYSADTRELNARVAEAQNQIDQAHSQLAQANREMTQVRIEPVQGTPVAVTNSMEITVSPDGVVISELVSPQDALDTVQGITSTAALEDQARRGAVDVIQSITSPAELQHELDLYDAFIERIDAEKRIETHNVVTAVRELPDVSVVSTESSVDRFASFADVVNSETRQPVTKVAPVVPSSEFASMVDRISQQEAQEAIGVVQGITSVSPLQARVNEIEAAEREWNHKEVSIARELPGPSEVSPILTESSVDTFDNWFARADLSSAEKPLQYEISQDACLVVPGVEDLSRVAQRQVERQDMIDFINRSEHYMDGFEGSRIKNEVYAAGEGLMSESAPYEYLGEKVPTLFESCKESAQIGFGQVAKFGANLYKSASEKAAPYVSKASGVVTAGLEKNSSMWLNVFDKTWEKNAPGCVKRLALKACDNPEIATAVTVITAGALAYVGYKAVKKSMSKKPAQTQPVAEGLDAPKGVTFEDAYKAFNNDACKYERGHTDAKTEAQLKNDLVELFCLYPKGTTAKILNISNGHNSFMDNNFRSRVQKYMKSSCDAAYNTLHALLQKRQPAQPAAPATPAAKPVKAQPKRGWFSWLGNGIDANVGF